MVKNNEDFIEGIARLVEQADEVGRMCSDEAVRWSTNDFLAVDVHNKYMIWKCDAQEFLQDHDFLLDAKFLMVENAVPMLKGGIEYGDKDSAQSRGLIRAISLELDEKLKHLRSLSHQGDSKKLDEARDIDNEGKISICCSMKDGIYFHGSKLRPYKISKQRFKIVEVLYSEETARLKEITKKAGTASEQNTSRDIMTINREFKEKLKLEYDFIQRSTAVGFHLNDAMYDISLL